MFKFELYLNWFVVWLLFLCVSSKVGERIIGFFGFVDMVVIGFEFIIVEIFVRKVIKILWVRVLVEVFKSRVFKICLVVLIICFYIFFMWEEWGVLKI